MKKIHLYGLLSLSVSGLLYASQEAAMSRLPFNISPLAVRIIFSVILFLGWALFDAYLLQRFLKLSTYRIALWNMIRLSLWAALYAFIPMVLVVACVAICISLNPLLATYFADSLVGVINLLQQGLFKQAIASGLVQLILSAAVMIPVVYLQCYIYRRHIDASVNYAILQKTLFMITIINFVCGQIPPLLMYLF